MYQALFLSKNANCRPATSLKKETLTQVFFCEYVEISQGTFFTEDHRGQLLKTHRKNDCVKLFAITHLRIPS